MNNNKEASRKIIKVDFDSGTQNNSKECNSSMLQKTNHQYLYNGDPNYTVDPERIEQVLLSVIEKFETNPDKDVFTQRSTNITLNGLYEVLKDLKILGVLPPEQVNPSRMIGEPDLAINCDTCGERCRLINRDGDYLFENLVCDSKNKFALHMVDVQSCKNCDFSLKWVDCSAIQEYPDPQILLTCYAHTRIRGQSIVDVFDDKKSFSKDFIRLTLVEKFGWCPKWKIDNSLKTTPPGNDSICKEAFCEAVKNASQIKMDGYIPGYRYDDRSVRAGDFT